ncbi:hypothetical protein Acr_00g0065340 [Actinidia rufa]|uniref:Retrotransposon gag domain-containing protein n=1 Tax=Actinidia rufa TaxID=165716 RepID=A0A7J0DPS7_9ERIC|nr:hypothetical protein Acr_00g0065340 [Actinidia rufa]
MDTGRKINTEFHNEVSEVLARHESSFDQIHATLQTITADLQALKLKPMFPLLATSTPLRNCPPMASLVRQIQGFVSWTEFTMALLYRFGPTEYENPSKALTRLKHTTTVSAYQEEFEKLSQLIDALLDNHLIGIFIAGLKDEVHLDVKLKNPRTLSEASASLDSSRNATASKRKPTPTTGLLGPPPISKTIP